MNLFLFFCTIRIVWFVAAQVLRVKAFTFGAIHFLAHIVIARVVGRTIFWVREKAVRFRTVVCLHRGRDWRFGGRLPFGGRWLSGGRCGFGRRTVAILWPFTIFGFRTEQQRRRTINQIGLVEETRIKSVTMQLVTKSAKHAGTVEHPRTVRLASGDAGVIHRTPFFLERTQFWDGHSIFTSDRTK